LGLKIPADTLKVGAHTSHHASNVNTIIHKQNELKYMHQGMFSRPIATLIDAINKTFLEGFSFMKSKLVQKYLAKSPATSKGRMKRSHTGIRSTRPHGIVMVTYHIPVKANQHPDVEQQLTAVEDANIISQDPADTMNKIFCFAALADKQKGTFYTDVTASLNDEVSQSRRLLLQRLLV
jgi:hypothetical protein